MCLIFGESEKKSSNAVQCRNKKQGLKWYSVTELNFGTFRMTIQVNISESKRLRAQMCRLALRKWSRGRRVLSAFIRFVVEARRRAAPSDERTMRAIIRLFNGFQWRALQRSGDPRWHVDNHVNLQAARWVTSTPTPVRIRVIRDQIRRAVARATRLLFFACAH